MNFKDKAIYNLIKLSPQMNGVFTKQDIKKIFHSTANSTIDRKINMLIKAGILHKVYSSIFADENASLASVAMRIFPDGYISLGYALAKYHMVGTFPAAKIDILTQRARPKEIETYLGKINMSVQSEHLHFGYKVQDKLRIAVPEKALIDTLYFHLKGKKYHFDLNSEIDMGFLDKKIIKKILEHYKNKKFIAFVKNITGLHNE